MKRKNDDFAFFALAFLFLVMPWILSWLVIWNT